MLTATDCELCGRAFERAGEIRICESCLSLEVLFGSARRMVWRQWRQSREARHVSNELLWTGRDVRTTFPDERIPNWWPTRLWDYEILWIGELLERNLEGPGPWGPQPWLYFAIPLPGQNEALQVRLNEKAVRRRGSDVWIAMSMDPHTDSTVEIRAGVKADVPEARHIEALRGRQLLLKAIPPTARGRGRPSLLETEDMWRPELERAQDLKRRHPTLTWADIASRIGASEHQLREWRREDRRRT